MKAIDIVLPPARTNLEDWGRVLNWRHTEFATRPTAKRTQIIIKTDKTCTVCDRSFTAAFTSTCSDKCDYTASSEADDWRE